MKAKYKRILLKISGEALSGAAGHGFDPESLKSVAEQILEVAKLGVEVGIVVGGGNIWRGRQGMNMDRVTADQMGMLATVINALAVSETLIGAGADARVLTSIEISGVGEKFNHKVADRYLKEGKIVVFGGGTGNPFFSTDTAAALRSVEINADALLKATNVDGIFDKDPNKYADAVKYDNVTFQEVITKDLKVMDSTAFSLCKDNDMPIIVFNLNEPDNILRVVNGEKIGTTVKNQ